jgi:hypothetical protein
MKDVIQIALRFALQNSHCATESVMDYMTLSESERREEEALNGIGIVQSNCNKWSRKAE